MPLTLTTRTERLLRERDREAGREGGRTAALEVALELCAAVALFGSVLGVGAVHLPIVVGVSAAATCALALAVRLGGQQSFRPAAIFGVLALYSAFQALPLPMGWLRAIAPANADVWARALAPLGADLAAAPISLDPGATLIEALRWYTYGAVFVAVATIASRRGPAWGLGVVFVAALAAAVTTVGHGLLGASKVFGVYEPTFRPLPWHVGPLLNPNNLSGYLNLGVFCGLGLLAGHKASAPRWMVGAGIIVLFAVNVTTGSRGGLAVLILGLIALTVVLFITGRKRAGGTAAWARVALVSLAALATAVAFAFLGGAHRIWSELYDQSLGKLDMLRWVKGVALDHPIWGIGRGSFESVFPAYQPSDGAVVFTHAENFIAQWIIEWGLVVAVPAILAFAWFFRPKKLALGRSALATSAWIGVLALAVQNCFDLALEIPGVCVAACTVLGTLSGAARRNDTAPKRRSVPSGRLIWTTLAVGAAFILGAVLVGRHDLTGDRRSLQAAVLGGVPPRDDADLSALRHELRLAMRRHPAEPYFSLLGATLAIQEGDESPMPWLQRTLERARVNGRAHLLVAYTLGRAGLRQQALLELRLALESEPRLAAEAAVTASWLVRNIDDVVIAAPPSSGGAPMLDALGAQLSARGRRPLGALCDSLAVERDPARPGPHERLAMDVVARAAAGECVDVAACTRDLDAHADAVAHIDSRGSGATRLRARLLVALGRFDEAETMLSAGCEGVSDVRACLWLRAEAASHISDMNRLAAAGKALLVASCIRSDSCAEAATWLGDLHAQRHEWGAAVADYQRATRDAPSDGRWVKLADAASKAGLHAQAAQIYERLLRHLDDPVLREKLARERGDGTPY